MRVATSERRRRAIQYIAWYWTEYWTSPSYREIGEAVGLDSKSSVSHLLNALVRDGELERRRVPGYQRVIYRVRRAA